MGTSSDLRQNAETKFFFPRAIIIKHFRKKQKFREIFATELQQNQRTL